MGRNSGASHHYQYQLRGVIIRNQSNNSRRRRRSVHTVANNHHSWNNECNNAPPLTPETGAHKTLKKDWVGIGKELLQVVFDKADIECPKWLLDGMLEDAGSSISDEDLREERGECIRGALAGYINDAWARHRDQDGRI